MKYDSSITYYSKAMANVIVFADKQKGQKDRRSNGWAKIYVPMIIDAGA